MSFKNFTHVILDEIHERDMDSDLVSLIVKLLTKDNMDTKLIIMSATLQGDMFLRWMLYIDKCLHLLVASLLLPGTDTTGFPNRRFQ